MEIPQHFLAYVLNSFVTSIDYRNGFLSAVVLGVTVQIVFRMIRKTWKAIVAMKAPTKLPATKDGPSALALVSKSIQRAVGVAMFVAVLWITVF